MAYNSTSWTKEALTKAGNTVTTSGDTSINGSLTCTALQLSSNVIKASDGGSTITLDTDDNVTILGDLTVTGNTITFGNTEVIHNEANGTIQMNTQLFKVSGLLASAATGMHLISKANYDTQVLFYEGVGGAPKWSIGNDATGDSFKWDAGHATVGGATKLALDSSGNLTVTGDLTITGGNITNAITCDSDLTVTGTVYAARILYHTGDTNTYLDFTDDRIALYAGGNTVLDYDEDSTSTLKLAASGEADTTIGDSTTFFVGGSDGSYDTKVGIGTATPSAALNVIGTVIVGADTDGYDVKFFGNTTANYMLWDESADTLKLQGAAIHITQLGVGSNNYEPRLNFYNYDADNSSSQGMSNINFYNSKSDSETNAETDADAHLGRIVWHASTDSDFKYAGSINCLQTSDHQGSLNYVGSQLKFVSRAQIDTGDTVASSLCWAPPATPAADNLPNLILNGSSANITQASANQLYIKNGVAPGTVMDTYIAIGSKNIGGDTALELTQEEAPVEEAVTSDWTLQVTINGKIYKILLDYVSG